MRPMKVLALTSAILTAISFLGEEAQAAQLIKKNACASVCTGPQSHFGVRRLSRNKLPQQFKVMVWNVSKGAGSEGRQARDLKSLTKRADVVLLQDATDKKDFASTLKGARPDFRWSLAHAFEGRTGFASGVATGSNLVPVRSDARRSKVVEPITNSPRSMLLTRYKLKGRKDALLVVNIHAVSFGTDKMFETHMKQMVREIKRHKGPVVIGGDFNIWREKRMNFLLKTTQQLGISKVAMNGSPLSTGDHVFVRGLKVQSAEEMLDIESSDQKPIEMVLEIDDDLHLAKH